MCEPWEWTSQAVTSSQSPEAMEITAKINKCNLTKLTSFCTAQDIINKTEDNPQNGGQYLQMMQLTGD